MEYDRSCPLEIADRDWLILLLMAYSRLIINLTEDQPYLKENPFRKAFP